MKRTYALIGFLSGHDRLSICFPRSSRDFSFDLIIRHFRNVKITEAKMRSAIISGHGIVSGDAPVSY